VIFRVANSFAQNQQSWETGHLIKTSYCSVLSRVDLV